MNLREMTAKIQGLGYDIADARARVCQDIVLKAIANSSLSRNVTIKGGVVMRSMTGNIRRACDMVDFDKLKKCCDTYIFNDSGMRENDMMDVVKRVKSVFGNVAYKNRVDKSDKRWIDDDIEDIFEKIIDFLKELY